MNPKAEMKKSEKEENLGDRCALCRYYKEYPPEDRDDEDDLDDLPADMREDIEDFADQVTGSISGWCRRFPPRIFPGLTPISILPDVSGKYGWCGEFMPASMP
jgi:hypothetical protein